MIDTYFEDFEEGAVYELGSYTVPAEEMRAFAERYDPQPIHVDERAADESMYGGLIASGWYTASVCMRLVVDGLFADAASMGSFGLDELRWHAPVRAGDTLSATVEVLETRPSASRDDRGYVRNRVAGTNQDGDEVIHWIASNIFGRRDA